MRVTATAVLWDDGDAKDGLCPPALGSCHLPDRWSTPEAFKYFGVRPLVQGGMARVYYHGGRRSITELPEHMWEQLEAGAIRLLMTGEAFEFQVETDLKTYNQERKNNGLSF